MLPYNASKIKKKQALMYIVIPTFENGKSDAN